MCDSYVGQTSCGFDVNWVDEYSNSTCVGISGEMYHIKMPYN